MSVGEKLIRATQWQPLDGSASNAIPKWGVAAGTQTQKLQLPIVSFDGAGSTVQYACYSTRLPNDYAAGGSFAILWMSPGTTGTVKWQAQVAAVTPADTDTPLEHAWGTAATQTVSPDTGEAQRLVQTPITLNMDSAAAGDLISFLISRDPANDTCTSDAQLISVAFQYTADDQAGSPLGYIGEGKGVGTQTGIGATITDITSCSVPFTALASRRYKISFRGTVLQQTSDGVVNFYIRDGSNTQILVPGATVKASAYADFSGYVTVTPSAGSVTYKLSARTSAGTIDLNQSSSDPTSILVEDIGAV